MVGHRARRRPARAAIQAGIGGFETLEVFEPFDRAWRRVGLALDRVGFTVEDRDRQKGQYFVRYADTDALDMAKQGRREGPAVQARVLEIERPDGARPSSTGSTSASSRASAWCRSSNKDGAQANTQTTRRIVALLYEQLK